MDERKKKSAHAQLVDVVAKAYSAMALAELGIRSGSVKLLDVSERSASLSAVVLKAESIEAGVQHGGAALFVVKLRATRFSVTRTFPRWR